MSEAPPELDWIQLHDDLEKVYKHETMLEKMKRKTRENPYVPVGCLATLAALSYGLWSFRKGRREMSQRMMRVRVLAQGFTVAAFVIGLGFSASKIKK